MNLDQGYWEKRYVEKTWGWDIGYPSPALIEFASKFDKSAKILIPGCGHAYEGEWLWKQGYTNLQLMDLSITARNNFLQRVPEFPENQFSVADFFDHESEYDLILEQTFFCALNPDMREGYANKMLELLKKDGQLAGLLFTFPLTEKGPPFGGSLKEYQQLFQSKFTIVHLDIAQNSIAPRAGKEAFFILQKSNESPYLSVE